MTIKKVWINPGCITCGACEFVAPKIFEVTDISHITPCAQESPALIAQESAAIKEAAQACPVNVIKYEE